MELGSVTLKRIGFFCFPIKHSTYTTLLAHAGGVLCGRSSVRYGTRLGDLHRGHCSSIDGVLAYINVPPEYKSQREVVSFVFQLNTQHTPRNKTAATRGRRVCASFRSVGSMRREYFLLFYCTLSKIPARLFVVQNTPRAPNNPLL